jgi:hypothetical protein
MKLSVVSIKYFLPRRAITYKRASKREAVGTESRLAFRLYKENHSIRVILYLTKTIPCT